MDTPPLPRAVVSSRPAVPGERQRGAAPMRLYQEDTAPWLDALRESAGEATVRDDREDEDHD